MFSGKIPSPFNVYRSIGTLRTERYGIGVMDKTGCSSDYTNRAHPEYVIVLVLRGWGLYIDSSGTEYPLHPGSCFQRFAGVPHTTRIEPDSGWVECFLQLGETMAALLENCAVAERERPVLTTAITPGVLERIRALRDSFLNAADAELIHQLPEILELAQLLLSGESPKSGDERKKLLEQACAYLGGNFRRNDDLRGFCRRRLRLRKLPQNLQRGAGHLASPLPDPAPTGRCMRPAERSHPFHRLHRRTARLQLAV